jgi:hypothetical protein
MGIAARLAWTDCRELFAEHPAGPNDFPDFHGVGDIAERIGIDQNKVGVQAGDDGAGARLPAQRARGIPGRRLERFQWGEAAEHQLTQLFVESRSRPRSPSVPASTSPPAS